MNNKNKTIFMKWNQNACVSIGWYGDKGARENLLKGTLCGKGQNNWKNQLV